MSCQIMGVVNVTPDSFSDGGLFSDTQAALDYALRLVEQGADILDVGGESTRPGAAPVPLEDELARTQPLIAALRGRTSAKISIDTMKPAVARAAIAAGADMWNDVSALSYRPESLAMAAELGCEVVLMHKQGDPSTMQNAPRYDDVVDEVAAYLLQRATLATQAGVQPSHIWLDPGLGFGKTLEHNLRLLNALPRLVKLGFPLVLGASRKRYIRALDPSASHPLDRLGGSIAAALAGATAGVSAVRVHDVKETRQALLMASAIRKAGQ